MSLGLTLPRPEEGLHLAVMEVIINGGLMRQDLSFSDIMESKRPRVMEKLRRVKRWIIMGHP